ncbi:replicative DNA helicase [Candidatus Zinderia endosymbiont of Aphrophora alni]|uniref:replicative DNA helicase n=1 Tax=Candidatus Zinderia endosymbiont of Aphrophora alni TaxID=3077951 RepID=UPI0030D3BC03
MKNINLKLNFLRVLPHSIEAEQSILGGLLINNLAWEYIYGYINENHFYKYDHRIIFKHISKLINETKSADVITVYESMLEQGNFNTKNGLNYLNSLIQNTPSIINLKKYAKIIKERSILRKLIIVSNNIIENAFNPKGKNIKNILDEAESKIFSISNMEFQKNQVFIKIQPLLNKVAKQIKKLYKKKNFKDVTGISTGFIDLDKITSGFQPGDLIIIASRPSMGKTAFSINIGENVAINSGLPVVVFSMEMGGTQLAMRMLSSVGKLEQQRLRTGQLLEGDWKRLVYTIKKMKKIKFYIDESPSLSSMDVKLRSRRIARKYGKLGLIIIDYLQLMSGQNYQENRASEISEISRSLKNLAKELNCPIVALSQLNRSLEQRLNKRPIMSDLRESGALEQDADLILFIYRDELYNLNSKNKGIAEIIIAKQRNGPIGNIKLSFLGKFIKYENYIKNF